MAEINITIKDGKVNIDVEGLEGVSCTELTSLLERELGSVEEVTHKPAYYNELDGLEIHVSEE